MRDYNGLEPVMHPYLGFTSPLNFRTPSVTTDSLGFRRSEFQGKLVSSDSMPADGGYGVALGASFTFGVGATHDRHSVVSRLAEETGKPYLNRAVRAGNSIQEFLAALPVLGRAEDVVICTGVNTLAISFWSSRTYDDLGPLFYDERIARLAGRPLGELADFKDSFVSGMRDAVTARRGRGAPLKPPRPALDGEAIMASAADRHLRDLRQAVAAAHSATNVIFVLQSFVDPDERQLHTEERELIKPRGDWWSSTVEYVEEQWDAYTQRLRSGCEAMGVRFGELKASEFEGWAYVDRVHMTDAGQDQAARKIVGMMG